MTTPRQISMVPSVTTKEWMRNRTTSAPLTAPSAAPTATDNTAARIDGNSIVAHQHDADVGGEAEHRADRQIEVTADHQQCHADADDSEFRRHRHDADVSQLVGKQIWAEDGEDDEQNDRRRERSRLRPQHQPARRLPDEDAPRRACGLSGSCSHSAHPRREVGVETLPWARGRATCRRRRVLKQPPTETWPRLFATVRPITQAPHPTSPRKRRGEGSTA